MDWHQLKEWLTAASGLDMDALHVHAGLLCQIAAALVLRRRLSSPWPWLVVAAIVIANEVYDFGYEIWPDRRDQLAEGWRDTWNTLLLPTALMLAVRFLPCLFRPPGSAADPGETGAESGEAGEAAKHGH